MLNEIIQPFAFCEQLKYRLIKHERELDNGRIEPSTKWRQFKKEHAAEYQAALDKAKDDYMKFYAEMGNQKLDLDKYSESIEHRAKEYCRDWLKEMQGEIKG